MLKRLLSIFRGPQRVDAIAQVEIYTWKTCPYCWKAKRLLNQKGASFTEVPIDGDEEARQAMAERASGRRTVPQIFIEGQHIGGCDDLHALERSGELDQLLTCRSSHERAT